MTSIDATSTTTTSSTTTAPKSAFAAGSELFLKLLTVNLQNQDPMSPQNTEDQMAQLSQMTMVEQLTGLATAQRASNALSLLGKSVTYTTPEGVESTATVDSVDVSGPHLRLRTGERISPEKVKNVVA